MNILSELESILEREQQLLLNGNFSDLQSLVDRKTKLSEWLARTKPEFSKDDYQRLAIRAQQNEALLEASRRGLSAAMAQLRQTREATEQATYSRSGERQSLSRMPSSVTQKV